MVKKAETYESMMKDLEKILGDMEKPETTLQDNLKNYEDGVLLCNKMNKILNEAENKIKLITENGEVDFDQKEE